MKIKRIHTLLFSCLTLFSSVLQAAPITSEQATKLADEFMLTQRKEFPDGIKHDIIDLKEVYVINYVTSRESLGFVIVGGDDALPSPILAYGSKGKITKSQKTMEGILKNYCEEIKEFQSGKAQYSTENAVYYERKETTCVPLLQGITWNQSTPYNLRIPRDVDGKHSLVGCTPIAMGQIMKFYQYPNRGTGINTYSRTNSKGKEFSLAVDYDSLQIDWSTIKDKYNFADSKQVAYSVSNLLYYCALSSEANFSSASTSAGIRSASIAMVKHFGYHPSIRLAFKKNFTDSEWEQLLYRELEAKRPVICSGNNHAFVCDGFDGDYFHFNWGWGGNLDGYFKLSALKTGKNNDRLFQTIIVNIRPDSQQDNNSKTVNVTKPGTLKQYISDKEENTITALTIVGKLNGKDFQLLRKMAGGTETIWEDSGELRKLDLSNAQIAEDQENPYTTLDLIKELGSLSISGKYTPDKKPRTYKLETITPAQWDTVCQLSNNQAKTKRWKYIKKNDKYCMEYFTRENEITSYLFKDCSNLIELTLPKSSLKIGQLAFFNCISLQQMEIPAPTLDIHPRAWQGCLSMQAINTNASNTHFKSNNGILYTKDLASLIYYPSYKTDDSLEMPQSVSKMHSYTFDEALFLKEIKLSDQIKTIPRYTFYVCPSLQSIRIPKGVTELYSNTFYLCTNLSTVYLPSTIQKLDNGLFYRCNDLTDIYCESVTPPAVTAKTFDCITAKDDVNLWVPKGTVELYKQSPWNCFKNITEL